MRVDYSRAPRPSVCCRVDGERLDLSARDNASRLCRHSELPLVSYHGCRLARSTSKQLHSIQIKSPDSRNPRRPSFLPTRSPSAIFGATHHIAQPQEFSSPAPGRRTAMPPAPPQGTVRRLLVAGLGNAPHPLTRHSVGQLVLKNLALRACADPSHLSGTPRFETARAGRHAYLVTQITLRAPPSSTPAAEWDSRPLEISFVIPKAAMNINGPTVAAAFEKLVPSPADQLDRPRSRSHSPALTSSPEEQQLDADPEARRRRRRRGGEGKKEPAVKRVKHLLRLITIQDDLDLLPSTLKYQPGGGPRGHNGVRSVSHSLSSTRYHRLWVGIGRPEERSEVARYVLSPMGRDEVRKCEFDQERGQGGEVLERAWREILRIGFEADEP